MHKNINKIYKLIKKLNKLWKNKYIYKHLNAGKV